MKQRLLQASLILISISLSGSSYAQDWPRFRGAEGKGDASAISWDGIVSEERELWRAELPGSGVSSPVVFGNHIYVTSADAEANQRVLLCYDATSGKRLWEHTLPFESYKKHKNNSFAASTPAADEAGVYVVWQSKAESAIYALTHEGQLRWTFDLGSYSHGQGPAASPLAWNGTLYLSNDQKEPSFLLAVDANDGTEKWRIPRLGKRACYASPGRIEFADGTEEILFSHCFEGVIGVDPATGNTKWHVAPFGTFSQRAICSPFVTSGGLIIAGSGAQGGDRIIVGLKRQLDQPEAPITEVFRVERGAPHVPTPVEVGGDLYLWGDLGIITCVSAETGIKKWQFRVGGNYFSSPICVGDYLVNIDTNGALVVVSRTDKPEEISRLELEEETRASPAVANGHLLVRTNSHLIAYKLPSP